jgi:hypothetical protein
MSVCQGEKPKKTSTIFSASRDYQLSMLGSLLLV